jgi:hypothetical protein
MREYWLQQYVKEHYRELGFSQLEGPFETGPDFTGVYQGKPVKVEAELKYEGYLQHPQGWADILIVGTLEPVPARCKDKLPLNIIPINPQKVLEWSKPLRQAYRQKMEEGRQKVIAQFPPEIQNILQSSTPMRPEKLAELGYALRVAPWNRFGNSLLEVYAYYIERKGREEGATIMCPPLALLKHKEEGFDDPEDEAVWRDWLNIAFAVATQFKLKPNMDSLTWIDVLDKKLRDVGNLDTADLKRLEPVVTFIESLI